MTTETNPRNALPWIEAAGFESAPPPPDLERSADRRDFLKVLGLGAAASLAACQRAPVQHAMPYLVPPDEVTPGVPIHYASTCTACPAACGLMITVLDGRPVKLEGNPDHPLSGGGLCAIGQSDLRALYDAGRLRAPMLNGKVADWKALDDHVAKGLGALRGTKGRLYVLAPTLVSPTTRETVEAFLAPYGGVLVEHDPGARSASAILEAYELLDGRAVVPSLHLERADVLVGFGADLLATGPEPVTHTRGYAARRREAEELGALRHVQIEGSLSLTGAAADERWPASATGQELLALHLLRAVAERSKEGWAPLVVAPLRTLAEPPGGVARVTRLAEELSGAAERALVVSGSASVTEQLAVATLNRLLGNEGSTLDLSTPARTRLGRDRDLTAFLDALAGGQVGGVIVLGLDPVDQLPNGGKVAEALRKLPLSVAITDRPTATAAACAAVASAHHGLEQWGDFAPRDGVLTLAQPTIRPLFETRHPVESLLAWSGTPGSSAYAHLRKTWQGRLSSDGSFEALFTAAVASAAPPLGSFPSLLTVAVVKSSEARKETAAVPARTDWGRVASALAPRTVVKGQLEVDLIEEVALRNGVHSHVPWLRELPDPLTRVSWSAAVRVAPERARALGLVDGDVVTVEASGANVTLPVRVTPGQHPDVLGVPVGYGRADGDPGANRNAYRLARFDGGRLVTHGLAAKITKTGRKESLPLVQPHGTTEGRPVVFQVARFDEEPHGADHLERTTLWPEKEATSPKWEMAIDLDACTGCSACVVACQAENNLPVVGATEIERNRDMYWLRIDRYFVGDEASPDVLFTPTLCAHCGNAPCETVCPVAATVHSEDGLNQQAYNRCVGTRYCANNCPYKVRRFNWFDHDFAEPVERLVLNPDVVVRSRGVMEKCTFCVQRIQAERISARRDGRASWGDVKTACQQSCPATAIAFGDATDPKSAVSRAKKSPRAYQVLADLGVKPSITYLARVRARKEQG